MWKGADEVRVNADKVLVRVKKEKEKKMKKSATLNLEWSLTFFAPLLVWYKNSKGDANPSDYWCVCVCNYILTGQLVWMNVHTHIMDSLFCRSNANLIKQYLKKILYSSVKNKPDILYIRVNTQTYISIFEMKSLPAYSSYYLIVWCTHSCLHLLPHCTLLR